MKKPKVKCSRCSNNNGSELFFSRKDKEWYCSNCTCYKCFKPTQDHARCRFCGALYHEKDGCCKEEDITPNIKHYCFICGKEFQNSLSNYLVRGNCCSDCNTKVIEELKKKSKQEIELV